MLAVAGQLRMLRSMGVPPPLTSETIMQRAVPSWVLHLVTTLLFGGQAGCHLVAGFGDLEATGAGGATSSGGGGGNEPTFTVGGEMIDLEETAVATLTNNGSGELDVATTGPFVFPTSWPTGSSYLVEVSLQPAGQYCAVENGDGEIADHDITNVVVECFDDDPSLSELTVAPGTFTPPFDETTTTYNADVTQQNITITATALQPSATIQANNNVVVSGAPTVFSVDPVATTTIQFRVTAESGAEKVYNMHVTVTP